MGCSGAPSAASPSMVLTSCPSAITASVVQDFTALPSRCTTQAPHCEVSQPTWVPVSLKFSRRNCTSSVRGSTLALTGLPFTIREILAISTLFICAPLRGSAVISNHSSHNMGHGGNEQPRKPCVIARSTCDEAIHPAYSGLDCFVIGPAKPGPSASKDGAA